MHVHIEAFLFEDEVRTEILVKDIVWLLATGRTGIPECSVAGTSSWAKLLLLEARWVYRHDEGVRHEDTYAVDVNRSIIASEEWIGPEVRQFSPDFVDLNNVGPALLQEIAIDGCITLMGEDRITQQTEVNDSDAVGEQHDATHIWSSIEKAGMA
jgi:hypothetical protein